MNNFRSEYIILMIAAFMATALNLGFWGFLNGAHALEGGMDYIFYVSAFLILTSFFSLFIGLLPYPWLGRFVVSLLFIASSIAAYYMAQYGTVIDDKMIQSVFETDAREVSDLLSWKLFVYFILLGVLPTWFVWWASFKKSEKFLMKLKKRAIFLLVCMLVLLGAIASQYAAFSSLGRNHKEVRYYILPNSWVKGLYDYAKSSFGMDDIEGYQHSVATYGSDAVKGNSWQGKKQKTLFVLIIGETARAQNFGINGYERNTTPELEKIGGLINFKNMTSCGTETAVSLPCMMSGMGRKEYNKKAAISRENLLDVVKRSGMDVVWIDNQSGCKHVCDRVSIRKASEGIEAKGCSEEGCFDEVLIDQVKKYTENIERDTLLVLHPMGSHGPAYYKRYPPQFERFKPACQFAQMDRCTTEEVRNAYDNTIAYTDHVIASVIKVLDDAAPKMDTGFLYVSDHGESLGELGIYLHGAPYVLAPSVQTHVASVMWLSPAYSRDRRLDVACLGGQSKSALSHDNLFHSVLGLLDIKTAVHQASLDFSSACHVLTAADEPDAHKVAQQRSPN